MNREYPRQNARLYFDLSVFWFSLGFLWAGMITIVIQTLVRQMTGDMKDIYLGWTLAVGALVSTLICIIAGSISDRSRWKMGRRRPYIIIGSLLSVPVLLYLTQVSNIPQLIIVFCLIQLFTNLATAPYQAMMPDMVPKEHQGAASAYMGMSGLLGQLGGLVACGALIEKPGGLWMIMGIFSVLIAGGMLYTVLRLPEPSAEGNPAVKLGAVGTLVEPFRVKPREHPDFFRLIASRFIINMGFYSCTEFLLYYVSDTLRAPNPVRLVTYIFVITTISGLIGNFPAGILSDRMSKKRVIYISGAITSVGILGFILTGSIPIAMGAAFVFGAGFGAFMAVDWAFATNLLPEKDEAKHMGIWHVAFTVPQVVAPFIGGALAYSINKSMGQGEGYRAVLLLALVYIGAGLLVLRPIREKPAASQNS